MSEWFKERAWKARVRQKRTGGSNPPPSVKIFGIVSMQSKHVYLSKRGIGVEICIEDELIYSVNLKKENADLIPVVKIPLISDIVAYLDGESIDFSLYLDKLYWKRCSSFERDVYIKLSGVKFGSFVSYEELAEMVSGKNYSRAVGSALSRNPFPLIIPCHRVLPKSFFRDRNSLGGFSCGVDIKFILLKIEKTL